VNCKDKNYKIIELSCNTIFSFDLNMISEINTLIKFIKFINYQFKILIDENIYESIETPYIKQVIYHPTKPTDYFLSTLTKYESIDFERIKNKNIQIVILFTQTSKWFWINYCKKTKICWFSYNNFYIEYKI
jgi:hypothetical protein